MLAAAPEEDRGVSMLAAAPEEDRGVSMLAAAFQCSPRRFNDL